MTPADREKMHNEQLDQVRLGAKENPVRYVEGQTLKQMRHPEGRFLEARKPLVTPVLRAASQITPRELDPVWNGVLWAGKPTMFAGDPGLGKSMMTADITARVTTGRPWPCETAEREPADVLMLSAEDDPEDTIVPRLLAAGADLSRVTFVSGIRESNLETGESRESWLSLDRHIDILGKAIASHDGRARLVIVDPISAFLGGIDTHRTSDVRMVLAGLAKVAAEHRVAMLVISHLRKSESANAAYRVTGSLAFVAAARAVYAVTKDPDDDSRRLLLPVKNNLGADTNGYSYCIKVDDEMRPYLEWGAERITKSVDEVLSVESTSRDLAKSTRVREVETWLKGQLGNGAVEARTVWQRSEAAGISERDIRSACRSLGVLKEVKGFRGAWHWSLPETDAPSVTVTRPSVSISVPLSQTNSQEADRDVQRVTSDSDGQGVHLWDDA